MARTRIDCCQPDCPERYPGCGAGCSRYKEQRAELNETNMAIRKAGQMDRVISSVQYNSQRIAKKGTA